ncbi:MAG TPA: heparinase II/III family protein, partial [Candidatus Binatia bacterium]
MKLARLKTMGLTEIAYRGRQEASKWLERVTANGGHHGPAARARGAFETPAAVFQRRFEGTGGGRFFAGAAVDGTAALLKKEMPDFSERTIKAADQITRGRFDLLGYRDLFFGDPIDWRLDPVADLRSPLVHWSRLNPLDAALVGDSKIVWELNRHQWLLDLGQAYRLTGDRRYAATFASYL